MPATREQLEDLALSRGEYEAIVERLGREPNALELGLFGSLWSEHCGYKHSRPLLRQFASDSPRLLVGQGAENAGAVRIGGGKAVVMKIESHNHPSAIEPYEGAATGVGGIVRDILSMGAHPIALLNSLRFGPLTGARNRYLFSRVVAGISGYGNCIGIPDVGGEICFSDTYSGNPLVNAMCVGLVDEADLVRSTAGEPGNALILVGADTGRDGIHGASGLASRAFEEEREMRPAVQVGNPFLEKVLIEACLELAATEHVVGMQDLGAAGLSSACVETAANAGAGFDIDVAAAPRRDAGMTPYEVMLSESQERMLVIARRGHEDAVIETLRKRDLDGVVIGRVTAGGRARVYDGGSLEGDVPVGLLADAPQYRPPARRPPWLDDLQSRDLDGLPLPDGGPNAALLRLLAAPNVASKEPVFRQYDHHVQTNTVIGPGADAAVLRVKGSATGIALAVDGNGRYCHLDPYEGGKIAVAEVCRNLSAVGAEPVALTDCLNFGNPERPETYYQLQECVRGMAEASRAFDAPVVSGNVSLYNETEGRGIYPTPIVGGLGLLDDAAAHCATAFRNEGDAVLLLGAGAVDLDASALGGSEYLEVVHGLVAGRPHVDLDAELAVQRACRRAIRAGLIESAHDCSDGGLAVALAECCIAGGVGFRGAGALAGRWDAALFGERQSRIVVSLAPRSLDAFARICREEGAPWTRLGAVGGTRLAASGLLDLPVDEMASAWRDGIPNAVSQPAG